MDYSSLIEKRQQRLEELETIISQPDFFNDQKQASETMREHAHLKKMMETWNELAISAQEPNKFGLKKPDSPRSGKYELPDSLRNKFELPDSLAHLSPWKPDYRAEGKMKVKPSVTMTSVVVIQKENLPSRVTVIDNNTLRLGRHFTISNGQAWNNGSFPDAFLDARTISMPLPR